jgi:hypothetical protein
VGISGVKQPGGELTKIAYVKLSEALYHNMYGEDNSVAVPTSFRAGEHIIGLAKQVMERLFPKVHVELIDYQKALRHTTGQFEVMSHVLADLMLDESGRDPVLVARLEKLGFRTIVAAIQSDCAKATIDERGIMLLKKYGQQAVDIFCLLDTTKQEWPLLHQIDSKDGCYMHLDDLIAMLVAMIVAYIMERKSGRVPDKVQRMTSRLFARQLGKLKRQVSAETAELLQLDKPYLLAHQRQVGYQPHLRPEQSEAAYSTLVFRRPEVVGIVIIGLLLDMLVFNNRLLWACIRVLSWKFKWLKWFTPEKLQGAVHGMVSHISHMGLELSVANAGNLMMKRVHQIPEKVEGHLFLLAILCNINGLIAEELCFSDLSGTKLSMEELFPSTV